MVETKHVRVWSSIRGLGTLHDGLESYDDMGNNDSKILEMGINKLAAKSN